MFADAATTQRSGRSVPTRNVLATGKPAGYPLPTRHVPVTNKGL